MMKDELQLFFIDELNGVEYEIVAGFKGSILFQIKAMDLSTLINRLQ